MFEEMNEGLPVDSPLGQAVVEELRTGQLMKQVRERDQMADVQRGRGERVRTKELNPTMMIPPTSYHYWGQRLGYDCWEDDQFVREYWRDNEVCRVKTRPASAMVGWSAAIEYGRRKMERQHLVNGVWVK